MMEFRNSKKIFERPSLFRVEKIPIISAYCKYFMTFYEKNLVL